MSEHLAAGLRALPDARSAFASTQAAWRFYKNDKTDLLTLIEPLIKEAQKGVSEYCDKYALAIHDWSRLNFKKHRSKLDSYAMTHKDDVGYELQSTILLSDRNGCPLAPVVQNLCRADGMLSSYQRSQKIHPHLDELCNRFTWLKQQNFGNPLVHIIDREADSAFHLRAWKNEHWLIRANDAPTVCYQGKSQKLKMVANQLSYQRCRQVNIKGRSAWQWIAETEIILKRKAKPKRLKEGKRVAPIAGDHLTLRLIVSRICNDEGKLLAQWLLLSNLKDVDAARLAIWYYWRWQIESFFKLLKQAGHQLEDWQQESGSAIAKRLMVASMACVLVWKIANSEHDQAKDIQHFLVRLSGRQMKRSKPVTHPALLAGLWSFLSMLEVLEHYDLEQIKTYAKLIKPG